VLPLERTLNRWIQLNGFSSPISARRAELPIPLCRAMSPPLISLNCYKVEHRGHSYYKLKKVLDINGTPMKSSVYVNGVSNRRGVWRHNYECLVAIC
jgi:hypothetical protein